MSLRSVHWTRPEEAWQNNTSCCIFASFLTVTPLPHVVESILSLLHTHQNNKYNLVAYLLGNPQAVQTAHFSWGLYIQLYSVALQIAIIVQSTAYTRRWGCLHVIITGFIGLTNVILLHTLGNRGHLGGRGHTGQLRLRCLFHIKVQRL